MREQYRGKGECWGIREGTSRIDGNPAASHYPCQEAGNNTTCLFGSHRYLHMVCVYSSPDFKTQIGDPPT